MMNRYFTELQEGMDVYDVKGDKIGTIGRIYRPAATVASTGTAPGTYAEPSTSGAEGYFKVDTGFLGLGKDLFIPASAITDVSGKRVTLNADKDRLDERGWDRRPSWVPEE
jgi:hypothetical protein